nr:RNA-dependent RNA polymerase [Hypera postica associated sinaivirus]
MCIPALMASLPRVPAKTVDNIVTALETRVLNVVPRPHPMLSRAPMAVNRFHTVLPYPLLKNTMARLYHSKPGPHPYQYRHEASQWVLNDLGQETWAIPHQVQKPHRGKRMVDLGNQVPKTLRGKKNHLSILSPQPIRKTAPSTTVTTQEKILLALELPCMTNQIQTLSQFASVTVMNSVTLSTLSEAYTTVLRSRAMMRKWLSTSTRLKNCAKYYGCSFPKEPIYSKHCCPYSALCSAQRKLSPLTKLSCLYVLSTAPDDLKTGKLQPLNFATWSSRYPKERQKQLLTAYEKLNLSQAVDSNQAKVNNFIKVETSEKNGDPRNISPRSDCFLSLLGPYMSAFEHSHGDSPFLVKGLSLPRRLTRLNRLRGYKYYYESDYSRFDMSISAEMIAQFEHTLLMLAYDLDTHSLFHQAFMHTITTDGYHENGVTYHTDGGRCSGDAHTSIMNGLINHFMTWFITFDLEQDVAVSVHEGDDGVVASNIDLSARFDLFGLFGFICKVDEYLTLDDVSFCGRYLSECDQLEDYSDPYRTLAKCHTSCANGLPNNLIYAKALSILSANPSTPILAAWAQHILNVTPTSLSRQRKHLMRTLRNMFKAERSRNCEVDLNAHLQPPSPQLRASFARRTGISIRSQIVYENYLLSLPYVPAQYDLIKRDVSIDDDASALHGDVLQVLAA